MVLAKSKEIAVKDILEFLKKHLVDDAITRTILMKPSKIVTGYIAIFADIPMVKEEENAEA